MGIGRVARGAAATARGSLALARAKAFSSEAAAAAAGNLFSLDGASFPWPAGSEIPTKTIDFIDNDSYGNRMGHLQPLVTRRYADFGMERSAICHPSGTAHR